MSLTHEQQLTLISKIWGKQDGWVFFPYIEGSATQKSERVRGYHEGPAFKWPEDRTKILEWMAKRQDDDLYWCPSIFEGKRRAMESAGDEHGLWADLDAVDPREIEEEYQPTIAWETSDGHYQALWLLQRGSGDLQGASWEGRENQRLTYYLGADISGWDTTQLLRVPGWRNHKPEHRGGTKEGPNKSLGQPFLGKLLWSNGRQYLPDDFSELPEVSSSAGRVETILEDQVDAIDRLEVWGKVRLRVSKRVREAMSRRDMAEAGEGNEQGRSGMLWEIERELADAGCSVPEIVAIVRESAWNKFEGRGDELKRLTVEASKAVNERSVETVKSLEEERAERPPASRLWNLLRGVKQPPWLVTGIWVEGGKGFIAGQPKSWKSWLALDLALSVSTGMPFLDTFTIPNPGPVLLIQEEDSLPLLKRRLNMIWPSKKTEKWSIDEENGGILITPADQAWADDEGPPVDALIGEGVVLAEPAWQAWLAETLEKGDTETGEPYKLIVLDPLMMITGEIEESKSSAMNEYIYRPLNQLSAKHNCAVCIVHHMRKGTEDGGVRGGQRMLGSVATHGFSECSLYLSTGIKGKINVETESKHEVTAGFKLAGLRKKGWDPIVEMEIDAEEQVSAGSRARNMRNARNDDRGNDEGSTSGQKRKPGRKLTPNHRMILLLDKEGPLRIPAIAQKLNLTRDGAFKQAKRLGEQGFIDLKRDGNGWLARKVETIA